MKKKICTKCNTEYDATLEFWHKHSNGKYGLRSVCKICSLKAMKTYREDPKAKERHRISQAEWRAKNPEKAIEIKYNAKSGDYVLYLKVHENEGLKTLQLVYNEDEYINVIGQLLITKQLYIISDLLALEYYQKWVNHGKMVDPTKIYYNKGYYSISGGVFQRTDLKTGNEIYDLHLCWSCLGCNDENIMRFQNKRPVIF